MANINRDYLVVLDVKTGNATAPNMYFYNTDKSTSNIYVQLVVKETVVKATPIENATDFVIVAKIIKPGKVLKEMTGVLVNIEEAIYEFDLPTDFTNLSGDYDVEFWVSAKVSDSNETITSSNIMYKVKQSILTELDPSIDDTNDYPLLIALKEELESLKNSGQISHTHENKSVLDGITSAKVTNWDTAYTHSQSTHFNGNYNNLTDKPIIPTNTSQLINDSGFITEGSIDFNFIDDTTINTNKTWSSSKIDSQIKDIKNEMQNIGKPTDEQVATVINQAIANGEIVAGGITSTAKTLLINILRNALYTSDQSANISALDSALNTGIGGGSNTKQFTITNTLSNASTSNTAVLIDENASYTATIIANNGYKLNAITVTMGGTDITSTAVSGTTITISAVTGNVVITVTTTATSSGGGSNEELPTDGLLAYFDLRNAEQTSGSGGSYVINATQGSGMLYSWYAMAETGDYGTTIKQSHYSNTTSTTDYDLGNAFTVIYKGYNGCFIDNNYFGNSLSYFAQINAYYNNTSGSTTKTNVGNTNAGKSSDPYNTLIMRVSNNILEIYVNGALDTTLDGNNYSDFSSWASKVLPQLLYNEGYATAFVLYNKALSEVEIVNSLGYLNTLEVK